METRIVRLLIALLFLHVYVYSQKVGVGTTNPTQALDVNGNIKLATDNVTPPTAGTIRYTGTDFEGYCNGQWSSFTNNDFVVDVVAPPAPSYKEGMGALLAISQGTGSNVSPNELFGQCLDAHDSYIVVGAPKATRNGKMSGAVYIFKRQGRHYIQYQEIIPSVQNDGDMFGYSVRLQGFFDIFEAPSKDFVLVVGAPGENNGQGAVYYYTFDHNGTYTSLKITNPSGMANDSFGYSVSTPAKISQTASGSLYGFVIGSPYQDGAGLADKGGAHVAHFTSPTSTPTLVQIAATNGSAGDRFGYSVSSDSNFVLVGAPYRDTVINGVFYQDAGAAYIFKYASNTWTQNRIMEADPGVPADNYFGHSVALSLRPGSTSISGTVTDPQGFIGVVGAPNYDIVPGDDRGRVFVYKKKLSEDDWTQSELAVGDEGVTEDRPKPKKLGFSVDVEGDMIIAGAPETNFIRCCGLAPVQKAGRSYLFMNICNIWTVHSQFSDRLSNGPLNNCSGGTCVAITKNTCVMGIPGAPVNGKGNMGKFKVAKFSKDADF